MTTLIDDRTGDQTARDIWRQWTAMWSGTVALADQIVAARFTAHTTKLANRMSVARPEYIRDREGLKAWVVATREALHDLTFTTTLGPFVEGDYVSGRWTATSVYPGGMPGATADAGSPLQHFGMDILRLEDGKVAEYWTIADTVSLLEQLGLVQFAEAE